MLAARNVSMTYRDGERDVEVLKSITLEVAQGSSVAILGASGTGKTTLLYMLGGLEVPTSGDVILGGVSFSELARQKRWDEISRIRCKQIGFIFQFHYLLPEFDAVENVVMPQLIAGTPLQAATKRATELLERVGLGHRLSHRPGALSGGEQQRVAVARAVANSPSVLLADEPTGNLDQKTGGSVADLLMEIQREEGTSLVVVTHSSTLASRMGRVVELSSSGLIERSLDSKVS